MEAKLPEEIFSDRTINSARSKPVTDEHPNEPVTLENYQTYAKGMSHTDARVEDLKLYVFLTITKGDGKSDDYINTFFDATVEQYVFLGGCTRAYFKLSRLHEPSMESRAISKLSRLCS